MKRIQILGLCSYPIESAATRYRLAQFVEPLANEGMELKVSPFLSSGQFKVLYGKGRIARKLIGISRSLIGRIRGALHASNFEILLVQREAMLFGPAFFERLYQMTGRLPLVLDLDDATYVPYTSPRFGKVGSALKFFGKTDQLIDRSEVVICGNRFIAEYVEARGKRAVVVPTVVDNEKFVPAQQPDRVPVVGWIGTHSTFPSLENILPVLSKLAENHEFELYIVGAGKERIELPGVKVVSRPWQLDREIEDFQCLDIGLYPIMTSPSANLDWLKGKSGFKAVQYMAVGIPFVMSPVGVCAEMGVPGETHFNANTVEDWYNSLDLLLTDRKRRLKMGAAAREHSIENYSLQSQTDILMGVFRDVIELAH